ncbi:hypothetical protein HK101_001976 [Irineochytrium annulatum]|nr:hypothetical protein HK101_001976 [Irineochytrium annulatum]
MRRAGGPRRLGDGAWTNERLTEFEGSDDDAGADSLSDSSDDDGASWPSPASTKRNSNRLSGLSDVTLLATPISSPRRLNGKVLSPTPEDSPTAKEDLPNVPPPPSSPFDDEPSTPGSGRAGPRLQRHPSFEEARSKFLGGEPRAGPPTATPPDTPAFQWSPRDRLNQSRMRHHTLLFSGRVNGVDWPEVVKRNSTWEPKAGYVEVPYPEREVEEPRGVFRALRDETVSVTPPDMGEDDGVGPKFDRSEEHTDQKPRGYPESKPEGVYIEESDSRECTKEDGAIEDRTSSQLTALNELLYNAGFSTLPGHTTDNISNVTDVVPLSHAIVVIQQLHQTLRIASDRLTGNEVALNRSNSDNKVLRDRVGRLKRELDVMGRSAAEAKARADKESARAKEMEGKMASMETQMRTLKRESEKMAKLLQQYQNNANGMQAFVELLTFN